MALYAVKENRTYVRSPIRAELQENDRYRFWGRVDELGGRFLRVITLSDKLTIHNAFLDLD
jgi:hypothetical protein